MRQSQQMDAIGRLAGSVAHDFNNMIQIILGNAELALRQMDEGDPLYQRLDEIQGSAKRATDLTRQLMVFAGRQPMRPVVVELNQAVDGMLSMLRRLMSERIDMVWQPSDTPKPLKIDVSQLDQILMNLVANASEAIKDTGQITISTGEITVDGKQSVALHWDPAPGVYIELSVSDTGQGMDYKTQERIFEPLFTTKKDQKRSGLGLSTVYGIVRQNKGFIEVTSVPGEGSAFKVYLPRHTVMKAVEEKAVEEKADKEERVVSGDETVLVVEDEPGILRITQGTLERLGYTVYAFSEPRKALQCAHEHAGQIDLLLTDVVMPQMSGWVLANKIRSVCPEIKCLFMSGYSLDAISQGREAAGDARIIQKPFAIHELAEHVREALASGPGNAAL